jgi:hypothetical protein
LHDKSQWRREKKNMATEFKKNLKRQFFFKLPPAAGGNTAQP